MKLSIIIPLYNEANNIMNLDSNIKTFIKKIESCNYEIIIVNAGSTDNTLAELETRFLDISNVHIYSTKRLYPGGARNKGVSYSKGDTLLFMDAGIKYSENFVEELIKNIEAGDYDVAWGELVRKPTDKLSKILVDLTYSNNSSKVIPAMIIKKEKFLQLGGFKEDLRALEDTDFIRRIDRIGLNQVRVRNAYSFYYDFPKTSYEIYKKWKLYNEHTIYSGLRKNKERAALIMNLGLIFGIINRKVRILIVPLTILLTILKFRKKGIKIYNNNQISKYIFISLVIDFATYLGLTKGIINRFWKKVLK